MKPWAYTPGPFVSQRFHKLWLVVWLASFRELWIMLTTRLTILKNKNAALYWSMLFTSDQLKDLHISLLRSIERILFMSFFSFAGFKMSRGCIDRGCWVISGFGRHPGLSSTSLWYRSDARQDKFRHSSYFIVIFQKYELMVSPKKKKNTQISVMKQPSIPLF